MTFIDDKFHNSYNNLVANQNFDYTRVGLIYECNIKDNINVRVKYNCHLNSFQNIIDKFEIHIKTQNLLSNDLLFYLKIL